MAKIRVTAGNEKINVNATKDMSAYYSALAKNWAVKTDGAVEGADFSSKFYAKEAKSLIESGTQDIEGIKSEALAAFDTESAEVLAAAEGFANSSEESAIEAANAVEAGKQGLNEILAHVPEKFAGFGLFDTKVTDHVLTGDEAVGWAIQGSLVTMTYPDAVARIEEAYAGGATVTYQGIKSKRASNGWYIADISKKDAVDELFTSTEIADFYVLDPENRQFYLPRNKWFAQFTGDSSKVNEFQEAGLPNITAEVNSFLIANPSGAFSGLGLGYTYNTGSQNYNSILNFDASKSNPIYGNSSTVQPSASLKLLYYKVGNTVVNEELIDVGNVLADLQLKADKSLSNTVGSVSQAFKNQSVGWGMPDYSAGVSIKTYTNETNQFTAPTNGILVIDLLSNSDGEKYVYINGAIVGRSMAYSGGQIGVDSICTLLISKGDKFYSNAMNAAVNYNTFYPCKGAK